MPQRISHYLKQERRRSGLTQADVAALLGLMSHSNVKGYERGRHLPSLRTALSYQAIFGKPVAELFGGVFAGIMEAVAVRAKTRQAHVSTLAESARTLRRKRSLRQITTS